MVSLNLAHPVYFRRMDIVDEELTSVFSQDSNVPCEGFPNPEVFARAANRGRQRLRPRDPTTLDFDVHTR